MSEQMVRLKNRLTEDLDSWWAVRDALIGSPHGNVYDKERDLASKRIEAIQAEVEVVAMAIRLFDAQEARIAANKARERQEAPDETL